MESGRGFAIAVTVVLGCGNAPLADAPGASDTAAADGTTTADGASGPTADETTAASSTSGGGEDDSSGGDTTDGDASSSTGEPEVFEPLDGEFPGYVTEDPESGRADRCAIDAPGDLSGAIAASPAYVLAYASGASSCGVPAPTDTQGGLIHRQGIDRLARGGSNHLIVSVSVESGLTAGFEVVELGTAGGDDHLGPNGHEALGPPDCADRIVHYATHPDGVYDHGGGLQVMGRYAIVPFEWIDDRDPAGFVIVDLDEPTAPVWGGTVVRTRGGVNNAGAAALTRLGDGTYAAMIFGNDSDEAELFVSEDTQVPLHASGWTSRWQGSTPSGFEPYQGVQFVTGCEGALYLAGSHKNGNDDWFDLWQVRLATDGSYAPTLTKVANRNVTCRSEATGDTRYCDLHAGGAVSVDPGGRVAAYGVEHYDHAFANVVGGVRYREFALP